MKLWKFFLIALLAGFLFILACSEDETTAPGDANDPNVFCDEGLCTSQPALKQQCIDTYNACIAANPDGNVDECVASALLRCNL